MRGRIESSACIETHRSLRSTGERLSKCKEGSFKIAFQLPTPCYVT